jgi:hypothetical protein
VQVYPQGFVLVVSGHAANLASVPADAHFVSPTEFSVDLMGIRVAGGTQTTSSSTGVVSTVTLTPTSADTTVDTRLRVTQSHDQISVGGGDQIQVIFS